MVRTPDYIETRLFINNEWETSADIFNLIRPFDGEHLTSVHAATGAQVDAAVRAATAAFPRWNALGADGRKSFIVTLAALIRKHIDDLALLESLNSGRGHFDTYMEATRGASQLDYFAAAAVDIKGETRMCDDGKVLLELKQPYGVVGAILPWNAPISMFVWKAGSAVAAGNCVVVKSSEKAPLTCCFLAGLVKEAGFPPGVISVISGPGTTTGAALAAHADVRKLSFTGSTATGRLLQKVSAETNMKKLQLELGGKSVAIVFADADLQRAARKTAFSISWYGGQTCFANTRILVQESAAEEFLGSFKASFSAVGADGQTKILVDPTADKQLEGMPPLVDRIQFENVMGYIDEGKKHSSPLIGGYRIGHKGYFIAPTIFFNLPSDCRLVREEIFGPVVCINTFKTEAEAVTAANDSEYGLYASVFTRDAARSMRVATALEAGMVGINTTSPDLAKGMAFGGWKSSGSGRDGWMHGLLSMVESKSINFSYGD